MMADERNEIKSGYRIPKKRANIRLSGDELFPTCYQSGSLELRSIELLRIQEARIAELEQRLQAVAVSGVGTGYQESLGKETVLLLIQRLARQVGINLTKRKVLEMVPGLGALVGAAMNGNYLQDVGWTARWKFQSRWLREKYPKLQEFEKP